MIPSPEAQQFVSTVNALCERYRVPHAAADIAVNAIDLDDAQKRIEQAQADLIGKIMADREAHPERHGSHAPLVM